MANAWFLDDSSAFDTMEATITGVGANTHAMAAPLYNVQRAAPSEAYTTANISGRGVISMTFSLPRGVGNITMDTVCVPGFQVLGEDIADQDRPRSISRLPTGTMTIAGITPEGPNTDGTVFFKPEKILSRAVGTQFQRIVVDTYRGFAALTIPSAARSSITINLSINVGQTFRVVIPRIMAGVRFTPSRNFNNSPSLQYVDPVQLGRRSGAFVSEDRKNPYRQPTLQYENIDTADLQRFENMFQAVGKTVPLTACIRPEQVGTLIYARMLDMSGSYDLYDDEGGVDYNSLSIPLQEVSRG